MVEPCYNPSIRDYLTNPSLVAKKGLYDDGEEVSDDLPDPWSDEPLYTELPAKAKSTSGRKSKELAKPNTSIDSSDGKEEHEDNERSEADDSEDLPA